jgi:uncharacterized protein YbjT (DUF2867 family)
MSDTTRRVLVTGATGKQGGAVARHLLASGGFSVRALTRDPDQPAARSLAELGAEVVEGDLDDRPSVERALAGVYGVFSVQNFWETGYDREVSQGIGLADAARAAGVDHFVYASVGSAHRDTGLSHFESKWRIENHIRDIGLPYTIFRPVFFMDNWEAPMLRTMVLGGTLAQPLSPHRGFQQIAVDDIGGIVTLAFRDRDEWLGREVDLAGDERTMPEIAEAFGEVIGRPVSYYQVPWDDYRAAAGDEYHDMFRWFEDVGYNADIPTVRQLYPALTSFDAYLEAGSWADEEPPVEAGGQG